MTEATKDFTVSVTVNIHIAQLRRLLQISDFIGGEPFDKTIKDVIDIAMERYDALFEKAAGRKEG